MLMFRAVWELEVIHYQLVEIPVEKLRLIGAVGLEPVGHRRGRQSLGADVAERGEGFQGSLRRVRWEVLGEGFGN